MIRPRPWSFKMSIFFSKIDNNGKKSWTGKVSHHYYLFFFCTSFCFQPWFSVQRAQLEYHLTAIHRDMSIGKTDKR